MKRYLIILTVLVVAVIVGCAVNEAVKEPEQPAVTPEQQKEAQYIAMLVQDAFNKRVQIYQWLLNKVKAGNVTEQDFVYVGQITLSQVVWAKQIKDKGADNPAVVKLMDSFMQGCQKDIKWLKQEFDRLFSRQPMPTVLRELTSQIT